MQRPRLVHFDLAVLTDPAASRAGLSLTRRWGLHRLRVFPHKGRFWLRAVRSRGIRVGQLLLACLSLNLMRLVFGITFLKVLFDVLVVLLLRADVQSNVEQELVELGEVELHLLLLDKADELQLLDLPVNLSDILGDVLLRHRVHAPFEVLRDGVQDFSWSLYFLGQDHLVPNFLRRLDGDGHHDVIGLSLALLALHALLLLAERGGQRFASGRLGLVLFVVVAVHVRLRYYVNERLVL
mmetsp:Transcript_34414/g.52699  ORF Transcript_34414/g.52699 Transcript_34414/m.52699 type:complete len:239 (+) Transcript_34414:130-846(+)